MKKRKDGRYQASITIENPLTGEKKRVYVYGYTEQEVYREKERVKKNNGMPILDNISFSDWLNEWLKIKKEELAQSTYDNYCLEINKHIKPTLSDVKLKNINPSMIRYILRKISGDRIKQYVYTILRAILEQAYRDELINRNPCISVKPPKYKAREKTIISDENFRLLMDNADIIYKRIFLLAYYTGMRRAEIAALQWKDIDFNHAIIHVNQAVKITSKGNIIGLPKSEQGIRNIMFSKNILHMLKEQNLYQKQRFLENGKILQNTDFVFTYISKFATMISPNEITHTFSRIKRLAKIKDPISFHSFRHTHTTKLVEAGIPIKAIQTRLGHATPSFTLEQYAHNTDKMQQQIIDLIDSEPKIS